MPFDTLLSRKLHLTAAQDQALRDLAHARNVSSQVLLAQFVQAGLAQAQRALNHEQAIVGQYLAEMFASPASLPALTEQRPH